ncbi:RND family efflux system, inner membrane transporter, AcrB family [Arcobacter venerupis]|uniref:RND family efflux system, inner membrane transporter, AcrB family n=1 Tax=Arcobacter venerupis TaxID=1054033 RepID=A0AAE7E2U1_9BACT|nr:efflux RND transporter permease subunit [Arcobacter venerupis]QKF66518.1 RND family efflux system, inner membrane transporter, AcrB family [Arcobacter venerupis]RWS48256.1 MFS transporter [Arcobacter venerupis]
MKGFNLSALAVKERAITLFLLVSFAFAGIYAFSKLGRAEDPSFTIKIMTVTSVWPGATVEEMQNLVAEPLEKRLQELRWYDHVETLMRPGYTNMTLFFKDTMPPKEVAEQFYEARKKLGDEAKSLPSGVVGPFINDEYSDVTFTLYSLKSSDLPQRKLAREAEVLRQQLLHVDGVKKVHIYGEQAEKIFVEFSYAKLANLGINPKAIFSAIQNQNSMTASGSINTKGAEVFIRLDSSYDDLEKIRNTAIVANGHTFKLSDIAQVKRGYEDPASYQIHNEGEPTLILGVVMKEGFNGLTLGENLQNEENKIISQLPTGISFTKITDQGVVIKDSIDEFLMKFVVALCVVMLVSLISMGWRVGIVVAAAVPLTLAIVFIIMIMTDRVLDRVTLGSLIIGLGLLVDDAIIAIEMMVVKLEEGLDKIQAASYAWTHAAAPMLSGTLVTIIGFIPIGFAHSTAGEYAGNIFWIVGFALLVSWVVAVVFTPYLGVKLLPNIKPIEGGHEAIYNTPNYKRLRKAVTWGVNHKKSVIFTVIGLFLVSGIGMGMLKQQFFPTSDRSEVLADIQMPKGSSIEATKAVVTEVETWLLKQPEAKNVTSYIGAGATRFFFSYNPELPDPSFAKIIIKTANSQDRDNLKWRFREEVVKGLGSSAHVRVSQLVFGPFPLYPVDFRVMGENTDKLREIANEIKAVMTDNPNTREINQDWGELTPEVHFALDQSRLRLIGLTPQDVSEQLQFLLKGIPLTQVREDIRTVDIVARSNGTDRLSPDKLTNLTLTTNEGKAIPLSQLGEIKVTDEDSFLRRRDRTPTISVRCDIAEGLQPPQVSNEIYQAIKPIIAKLPQGYRIEVGGNIEDSEKANKALLPIFPIMIILTLFVIVVQVRSLSMMTMVFLTAPLGLIGAVPILLLFNQPFGFNAILGLIGLSGILMRNTLILIVQIKDNEKRGHHSYDAIIEATVQRARPVILTALAAALAFIPLTHSVFWGSMAYTLIGGTIGGTALILLFLPALYAAWFKIKPVETRILS